MQIAFGNLGYSLSGRRGANQQLDREFFMDLGRDALVRVGRTGPNFHWVVWNAEDASIYDPKIGVRERFPSSIEGYYVIDRA